VRLLYSIQSVYVSSIWDKEGVKVIDIPLNFSLACGLSLFLSGCHFSAALRYAFLISSCVAESDTPVYNVSESPCAYPLPSCILLPIPRSQGGGGAYRANILNES
jgi:hypothetical protein